MEKLRVRIVRDYSPQNPFLNWDCEPSVAWSSYNELQGNHERIISEIESKLTVGIVKRHSKKILEIIELCCGDYTYTEKVDEIFWQLPHLKLTQYAQLCELLKIPYYLHSSIGYSQGDYCNVLIVLTNEDIKRVGFNINQWTKDEELFKSTAKLFDAWAWGDVFGYILEEKRNFTKIYEDGTTEEDCEWEQIDSCYGFYGDDWETNGIKEHLPKEVHDQLRYIEVEY